MKIVFLVTLTESLASAVIVALTKPCVGRSPRTKKILFLPSICTDELLLTPEFIKSFPTPPSAHESSER